MTKIVYKLGDMFASNEQCLIHGCNASNAFASGVAGIMRRLHPASYEAYRNAYVTRGYLKLGEVIWAESKGILIGNAITQEKYGRDKNVLYADYGALRVALKEVNDIVNGEYETVGMPQICCGLANGDWNIVKNIIEEESTNFTPVVYIVDPRIYNAVADDCLL